MVSNKELRTVVKDLINEAEDKILEEHMYYYNKYSTDGTTNSADASDAEEKQRKAEIEGDSTVGGIFDYLKTTYGYFEIESDNFKTILETLDAAYDSLSGVEGAIEQISVCAGSWTGSAAMGFKDSVLKPFPDSVINQRNLINEVREGVAAQRRIWINARKSAHSIAEATLKVLKDFSPGASLESAGGVGIAVLGAATAFVGLNLSPESNQEEASLLCGLINSAVKTVDTAKALEKAEETSRSKATASIDEEEVTIEQTAHLHNNNDPLNGEIAGDGVHSIIDSMHEALTKLDEAIKDEAGTLRTKLNTTVNDLQDMVGNPERASYIRPDRPGWVDDPPKSPGDRFRPD